MRAYASSRTEAGIRELAAQRGYAYREAPEPRQAERAPVAPVLPPIVLPEGDRSGLARTDDEMRMLVLLIKKQKTGSQIAAVIGRSKESVRGKMKDDAKMRKLRLAAAESNVIDFGCPRELRRIIDLVARMRGETFASVMAPVRFRGPAMARQAAMCAVKQARPNISIAQIGRIFRRDHTTVLYAMQVRGMTSPTLIAELDHPE